MIYMLHYVMIYSK